MNAEKIGQAIYEETRLSPFEPARGGAWSIARRLALQVYEQPQAVEEAKLSTWGGSEKIVLRKGLQLERANFLVAKMIARVYARSAGTVLGLTPEECAERESKVAAWLVAPPVAFAERYDEVGADFGALAEPFAITKTAAALRANEVLGTDVLVWRKSLPPIRRCRGLLGQLPDDEIDALVRKRTRRVRKVPLRKDGCAVCLSVA